jgi:hypothetical protein
MVNDMTSRPTSGETEDGNGNRWDTKDFYVVLLGVLTARVTYQAWQGSGIGNLVMHNSRPWYLIFRYSNAFSFVASIIVVLLLLLLQLFHKKCRLSKVVSTVIVLDLLGLLVAHVTSSCRSLRNIGCLSSLAVTVLAYFVICVMLSFFNRTTEVRRLQLRPLPLSQTERRNCGHRPTQKVSV